MAVVVVFNALRRKDVPGVVTDGLHVPYEYVSQYGSAKSVSQHTANRFERQGQGGREWPQNRARPRHLRLASFVSFLAHVASVLLRDTRPDHGGFQGRSFHKVLPEVMPTAHHHVTAPFADLTDQLPRSDGAMNARHLRLDVVVRGDGHATLCKHRIGSPVEHDATNIFMVQVYNDMLHEEALAYLLCLLDAFHDVLQLEAVAVPDHVTHPEGTKSGRQAKVLPLEQNVADHHGTLRLGIRIFVFLVQHSFIRLRLCRHPEEFGLAVVETQLQEAPADLVRKDLLVILARGTG